MPRIKRVNKKTKNSFKIKRSIRTFKEKMKGLKKVNRTKIAKK